MKRCNKIGVILLALVLLFVPTILPAQAAQAQTKADQYAGELIPGGIPFGVKFTTEGVLIVGFCDIEQGGATRNPAREAGLRVRDILTHINDEAIASAAMLGITDVRFLDLCDGGLYEKKDLVYGLAKVVGEFQPDVILAPDPDVTSECHIDHRNVGNAVKQIGYFAPYGGIMEEYGARPAPVQALAFYMTAKPNRFVKTADYLRLQNSAIFDCHRSQFPEGSGEGEAIKTYLKLRAIDFGLRSGKGRAEGFRVLGVTHMHCLPEAGD